MPRRTPRRQLEAFLRNLGATGNFTLAAQQAGLARSGLHKRQARDPEFAAAVARAQRRWREAPPEQRVESAEAGRRVGTAEPVRRHGIHSRDGLPLLTTPGSTHLSTYAGLPQLRRYIADPGQTRTPGRLTQAAIETVLKTLAATANVRLAAAAAGVAHSSLYRRARRDEAFARAMREALSIGYDQLEQQVLRSLEAALEGAVDSLDNPPRNGEGDHAEHGGGGPEPGMLDPTEPSPNPAMQRAWAAKTGEGAANLTFMRALWLLKFHRDVRLPEGWRFARERDRLRRGEFMGGYGRALMTDDEVMEELRKRMAFLRTQPDDED